MTHDVMTDMDVLAKVVRRYYEARSPDPEVRSRVAQHPRTRALGPFLSPMIGIDCAVTNLRHASRVVLVRWCWDAEDECQNDEERAALKRLSLFLLSMNKTSVAALLKLYGREVA